MAEGGYIKGADIIDVEDVQRTFRQIESDMEKLGKALKSTAQGLDIKLLGATDSDSINGLTGAIQSVADAMKKWKSANDVHREAMRQLNDEIKNQIGIAKAAAEEESIRTQQMKTATEEERKRLIEEKKYAEVAKQQAEADKARAKAQSDLAVAQARVATEQAKQQAIQQRANQTRTQNNQSISQQSLLIQQLVDEIEQYGVVTKNTLKSMDLQTISYRELAEAAKVMGARLKEMSAEEKVTGQVGADMVRVTKAINEELARQDANVARYSRNVGNYRSAFDGLGYSIQQVLREVPSAININQFFLAISNNIPTVIDQMKLFRREQSDIKEQLKGMNEGTKEYMELQKKQMSIGEKMMKSIFNWQSAVLVILLVLRKYGEKFIQNVNDWINKTADVINMAKLLKEVNEEASGTVGEMTAKFIALQKEWKGLEESSRSGWVKNHADDWKDLGVSINNVEDAESIYINNTKSFQDAIDRRARSIAAMKLASERYAQAFEKRNEAEQKSGANPYADMNVWQFAWSMAGHYSGESAYESQKKKQQKMVDDLNSEAKKLEDEAFAMITKWSLPDIVEEDGPKKTKEKMAQYESMWEKYMQSRYKMLEDGESKERQQELDSYTISVNQLRKSYDNKLEDLRVYAKQNKWSKEKLIAEEDQLYSQWYSANEAAEKEHDDKMLDIYNKYANERNKETIESQKRVSEERIKLILKEAEDASPVIKRRIKTTEDEAIKNRQLTETINNYREAIEKLKLVNDSDEEDKQKRLQYIDQLTEKIKKLQAQIDHSKALDGYSSLGDMLQRKGVFEAGGGTKRNILENILGKDAYAAYTEGSKELESAIDADYDKWLKATQDAVKTWYNTTIGYISDLISAYVQLSEAKVEAAESDTEAAKEAYEKEKALMEAGYASRIDAAWDEYQEKQKIQKQAEKDAKKAQEVQTAIDTATQASSMITAIANLYKAMSGGGAIGIAAATVLSGTMVAAFTASKIAAYNAAHTNYGEGGFEMVEQGGSHASGNDTELGVRNRHGRRMVVERNEGIGVFSTRGMRMYGRNRAEEFVKAFNSGTLDAESGVVQRLGAVNIHQGVVRTSVNLKRLEQGVAEIAKQGENTTYVDGNGNTIVKTGNTTKIYVK